MSDSSDEALMQRYGQGDADAFTVLYERYRGPLYRYFLRQLGDRSRTCPAMATQKCHWS